MSHISQAPSRQEVDSIVSMLMVALPFPPMPLDCLQGGDNTNAVSNSHDLLARAITSSILNPPSEQTRDSKQKVLIELQKQLTSLSEKYADEKDCSGEVYDIFSHSFRKFISTYDIRNPNASVKADVRFQPLDSIAFNDTTSVATRKHLQARVNAMKDSSELDEFIAQEMENEIPNSDYKHLLAIYALIS